VTLLRVQHTFQGFTGLPKDQFVNTFYFNTSGSAGSGDFDNVEAFIADFWQGDNVGAALPLLDYMSGITDSAGATVKIYDMADTPPREPVRETVVAYGNAGGAGASNLPAEVAICLSYNADPVSGIPIASLRGRIYLGPLNINAMTAVNSEQQARPNANVIAAMIEAATRMQFQANLVGDMAWMVYSQKLGTAHAIKHIWVDNEFDTQRRRGAVATFRSTADF